MLSSELKAFYMVARLGSITLAAKKLGLSQPTVTTQIRNLESHNTFVITYQMNVHQESGITTSVQRLPSKYKQQVFKTK